MGDATPLGVLGEEVSICNGGVSQLGGGKSGGVFLPLPGLGNWERRWGPELQAVILFIGLLYCFAGVAFVADVFMAGIEKITSKKVRVTENGKTRTVSVWNPTVANLTLMALGSSAPEILLSCIELVSNNMQSGELGPSTIVGSAAFNLHVIIAVCVVSIPSGELRAIKELPVFIVTASFSVFAYLWLVIILMFQSPDVVEVWEGVLTFLYFPVLVFLAYLADKGYVHRLFGQAQDVRPGKLVLTSDSTPQEKELMTLKIRQKYGGGPEVQEHMDELMHFEFDPRPSRAQLRMQATRDMLKSKPPLPFARSAANYSRLGSDDPATTALRQQACTNTGSMRRESSSTIEHACAHYMVKESDKKVACEIRRSGDCSKKCKVRVRTIEGTAKEKSDFEPVDEILWFYWNQKTRMVTVKIIEDTEYEGMEDFQLQLELPTDQDPSVVRLGEQSVANIFILDNNHPGVFKFKNSEIKVAESCDPKHVQIDVLRQKGTYGKVSCAYATEDITAIRGYDYKPIHGTLHFAHGEAHKTLTIDVLPKGRSEKTEEFRVVISDATGGATFDETEDADETSCYCTVTIAGDPEQQTWMGGLADIVAINPDQLALDNTNWCEQFQELKINSPAGFIDWILHILLFPWKLLCAICPPPSMCDGWMCFFVALAMVGGMTAVIGDLADMLGCSLGIPSSITAVTIVALGTSLPDTFASKTSAVQDPTADNSIGNVTGSNSVNVFLGLGLPWMIGAIYWTAKGVNLENVDDPWVAHGRSSGWEDHVYDYPATFVVPANGLASSVLVFSFTAVLNILILMARRRWFGGELGGGDVPKYVTAVVQVALWVAYVIFSISQSLAEEAEE